MRSEELPQRFSNKNVLVTGAAPGLGRHIAQCFAREGADMTILDFQAADETVREVTVLGRRCRSFQSDVRDEDGVKKAIDGAADFFGERYRGSCQQCRFQRTL